ncbi:uncharacterized protein si:ch211-248a14.8 [Erpetoichthys calabaricus]|uniref:uncharacterized protein si:ch211-248a14.8 n=1 Tax=Erpetoichthys calabaricus TaxID=27687 RepID=UPI002234C1A7|nr:uncharacterized protein si:ch211-248a14.8 [Erpetoichthys calabaricus]
MFSFWRFALLSVITFYILGSTLSDFLCRVFIMQYKYTFPVFLAFGEVLLTLLVLKLLRRMGWALIKPYSMRLGEQFLVPSICFSFQAVLDFWAVCYVHSRLFCMIQHLIPIACLAWEYGLGMPHACSSRVRLLVTIISVFSFLQDIQSLSDDYLACVYSLLSLLLDSLYLCWLQMTIQIQSHGSTSVVDVYYTIIVNSSLVLGLLWVLQMDYSHAIAQGSWNSLIFMGYLVAVLGLGSLFRFLICWTVLRGSAITASIMKLAKENFNLINGLWSSSMPASLISPSGMVLYAYWIITGKTRLVMDS